MEELLSSIEKVEDMATREALMVIARELNRIKSVEPVSSTLTEVAYAVNRITDNL